MSMEGFEWRPGRIENEWHRGRIENDGDGTLKVLWADGMVKRGAA